MSEARPARPWWLRWYGLAGIFLIFGLLLALAAARVLGFYQLFYMPSEAMAPTLLKNDRIVASMRGPGTLRRGDIVLVDTSHGIYVSRVAALGGDRIELVAGQVFLNGRAVPQRLLAVESVEGPPGFDRARRLAERFPDEEKPHLIYDSGEGSVDDFPATTVRPGHVFLLGDNRDLSADSRVSAENHGLEQVPLERIRGRPLFHSVGSSRAPGEPLTR